MLVYHTNTMNHIITKEESYAERRELFKNIWETSMALTEKEHIMSKPKIIKTLRLDEMDRAVAGKKKKQKIKNLRTVCNKLLDFCDRQDADDLFYEQMMSQERAQSKPVIETKIIKKKKTVKVKRNIKKTNSMISPTNQVILARPITSERKENFLKEKKTSRCTSPPKFKRKTTSFVTKKLSKPKQVTSNLSGDGIVLRKKIVKKKRSKKKTPSKQFLSSDSTLHSKYPFPSFEKKRILRINKVYIG